MFDVKGIERSVVGYHKLKNEFGDYPFGEEYIFKRPVPLRLLQRLFKINPQDPDPGLRDLIDCYPIDEDIAKVLEPYLEKKLDFEKYTFMLECSAVE